jgi:replicative DNA helicase
MAEVMDQIVVPHSVEAEKTILGCILLDNLAYGEAAETVSAEHFYLSSHREIYRAMGEMLANDQPVDIITLADDLMTQGKLSAIGGRAYLFSLTEGLPRHTNVVEYAAILGRKRMQRRVMAMAQDAMARAQGGEESPVEILAHLAAQADECIYGHAGADEPLVMAYSISALNRFHEQRAGKGESGTSYGLGTLDEFTGGMRPGEVTVVGARSGVGKSSLMVQMAVANCRAGIPVHLFSLEMTREQALRRIWSIVSGVPFKVIDNPTRANASEVNAVNATAEMVSQWPLRIHDSGDMDIGQIVALARSSIRKYGTRVVAVDYAQNVADEARDERSRVSNVSRKLTRMIKHERCALMLLSQLRKVDRESYSKPPHVGDLRETGQLENDAHLVLLLHRGWDDDEGRISSDAEVIIPKQRSGDTGILKAQFNRKTVIFE